MFKWIPGKVSPGSLNGRMAEELGRVTAKLHEHAMNYRLPADFSRPEWGHAGFSTTGQRRSVRWRVTAQRRGAGPVGPGEGGGARAALPERTAAGVGPDPRLTCTEGTSWSPRKGDVAVIDFDDCGLGYYACSTWPPCSRPSCGPARPLIIRSSQRATVVDTVPFGTFPPSVGLLNEFLVMRDTIILNFILGSAKQAVMEWGPARAKGILGLMRNYLNTGRYPGYLNLAHIS